MVCTADDLLEWKDFPKGLKVLLLDEEGVSDVEIRSKLEEMDYIVSTFHNIHDALTAISNKPEGFHVAVVEVSMTNQLECFKFLETARDLPTIMTSNIQCISTMMKCIALGAAEFLQKPLSEDKLRNIWQHVVHKAFNAKENGSSKSLKSIKETEELMDQIKHEEDEAENENVIETENSAHVTECDNEQSSASDKFPAPSTPQLKQGCRISSEQDCQDNTNNSVEKVSGELEEESKFVETTCNYSVVETTSDNSHSEVTVMDDQSSGINADKTIQHSNEGSKSESNLVPHMEKNVIKADSVSQGGHQKRSSLHPNTSGRKSSRKIKVDWTPELHKRFEKAVQDLGVDQAIPSRILELMKVDGLTRHNVASHLQKYRMHRRHIVPKDDGRRWQHLREPVQRVYPQKPIMAYPPYHPNHAFPPNQFYPVWGHPSNHPSSIQMWGHPGFPAWHPQDSWSWNSYPGMHDAWGRPLLPPSQGACSGFPQYASGFYSPGTFEDGKSIPKGSFDFHPAEEVIDKVVKEAISKPWLPLPLGLKPPSTESVLSELHRQGICNMPTPHFQC